MTTTGAVALVGDGTTHGFGTIGAGAVALAGTILGDGTVGAGAVVLLGVAVLAGAVASVGAVLGATLTGVVLGAGTETTAVVGTEDLIEVMRTIDQEEAIPIV